MRFSPRPTVVCRVFSLAIAAVLFLSSIPCSFASAYNAHPKLVVVIIIDQFRGDYLERYRDQFGEGGFRLLLDHGASFTDCNYDYANTRTAPGHATLFTGAYSNGHGIVANEWWDPKKKKMVTSVEDDGAELVGLTQDQAKDKIGASPHNLLADTLGDELKLATQGQARVFSLSLKDRAAILPGGYAADAAYWIDPKSGAWITSTYYRPDLPKWAQGFNAAHRAAKAQRRRYEEAGVAPVFLAIGGQRLEIEDLTEGQADVADRDRVKDIFFVVARGQDLHVDVVRSHASNLLVVNPFDGLQM